MIPRNTATRPDGMAAMRVYKSKRETYGHAHCTYVFSMLCARLLAANTPSVAIARALGFAHYAATLAVRLLRLDS